MADQIKESGVRVVELGYRCPDINRLNFLPFAPEESLDVLLNIKGYSGPHAPVDTRRAAGKPLVVQQSGVLGQGTLYPGEGTSLEELSRLFWCVKSWTMRADVNFAAPTIPDLFSDEVGKYAGMPPINSVRSCYTPETRSDDKILELTDAYGSGVPMDPKLPLTHPDNAETVRRYAFPLDPINKWEELLCRNRYFSWRPPEKVDNEWFSTPSVHQNSPYVLTFSTVRVTDENGTQTINLGDDIFALWSLSIMNSDYLCQKGLMFDTKLLECYIPTGEDKDAYFQAPPVQSGALTDAGHITGYGFHPIVSGNPAVLAHRKHYEETESGYYADFNPTEGRSYFPMVYFQMKFKTLPNANVDCKTAAVFSTVQPRFGWRRCGDLVILDQPLSGYAKGGTPAFTRPREILRTPIFAPNATTDMIVDVTLTPNSFWISPLGEVLY